MATRFHLLFAVLIASTSISAAEESSASPQVTLSVPVASSEQNIKKYKAQSFTFSVKNIDDRPVVLEDIGSSRGIRLYLVDKDKTRIEIFPFDARNGRVRSPVMENRRADHLAPGETATLTIRIPISVITEISSGSAIASIAANYPNNFRSATEIFSEPFTLPQVEK